MLEKRLSETKALLRGNKLDCLLVCGKANVHYFTGMNVLEDQEFAALIPAKGTPLLSLPQMYESEKSEFVGNSFQTLAGLFSENVKKFLKQAAATKIGFDSGLNAASLQLLQKDFPKKVFSDASQLVFSMRMHKDSTEVGLMEKALQIAEKTMVEAIDFVEPGLTEKQVADFVEQSLRKNGAGKGSFDAIIASGENSAFPHHKASDRVIGSNEALLLDLGAVYKSYCSDVTRTIFLGKPSQEFLKAYSVVEEALKKSFEKAKPGVACSFLDRIAREILSENGFGKNFIHSLGHGIGLEVHEPPKLSQKSVAKIVEGMVFTIEPGVYFPKRFGVRIENTALAKKNESVFLNELGTELIVKR